MWFLLLQPALAADLPIGVHTADVLGAPISGSAAITVHVYDSPTDGAVDATVLTDVPLTSGSATVLVDVDDELLATGDVWVSTNVDGIPTGPRQRLLAVPVARFIERIPATLEPPHACVPERTGSLYVDTDAHRLFQCDGTEWTGL